MEAEAFTQIIFLPIAYCKLPIDNSPMPYANDVVVSIVYAYGLECDHV